MSAFVLSSSTAQFIPAEIVREIFKYFSTPLEVQSGARRFLWYLGHLCVLGEPCHFRCAMNSGASLFCTLFLPLAMKMLGLNAFVSQSTFCIATKGCRSLSDSTAPPTRFIQSSSRVLDLLMAESEHWQDAFVAIRESEIPVFMAIKDRLPLLCSLTLFIEPDAGFPLQTTVLERCRDIFKRSASLDSRQIV